MSSKIDVKNFVVTDGATSTITLRFVCPLCETRLAKIDTSGVAGEVRRRTCRGCYRRWQIVVRVIPTTASGVRAIHSGDFTDITRRNER